MQVEEIVRDACMGWSMDTWRCPWMERVDGGDELEGKERKRRHKMEGARPGGRMWKQEVSDAAWAAVYAV